MRAIITICITSIASPLPGLALLVTDRAEDKANSRDESFLHEDIVHALITSHFTNAQIRELEARFRKDEEAEMQNGWMEADEGTAEQWNETLVDPAEPLSKSLAPHMPPVWFHCPKCGSSFINLLMHIPGACPHVPRGFVLGRDTPGMGKYFLRRFAKDMHFQRGCPPLKFQGGHIGLGGVLEYNMQNKGKIMGMFRKPADRIRSAFNDAMYENNGTLPYDAMSSWAWQGPPISDFSEYARGMKGCMAKMLARSGFACGSGPIDSQEMATAIERLQTGFAFVGLMEEWDLSICLWHKMFGGKCHAYEMMNSRPKIPTNWSKSSSTKDYDVSDEYDERVYSVAQEIFWNNTKKFDVSRETCNACFKAKEDLSEVSTVLETTGPKGNPLRNRFEHWMEQLTVSGATPRPRWKI